MSNSESGSHVHTSWQKARVHGQVSGWVCQLLSHGGKAVAWERGGSDLYSSSSLHASLLINVRGLQGGGADTGALVFGYEVGAAAVGANVHVQARGPVGAPLCGWFLHAQTGRWNSSAPPGQLCWRASRSGTCLSHLLIRNSSTGPHRRRFDAAATPAGASPLHFRYTFNFLAIQILVTAP